MTDEAPKKKGGRKARPTAKIRPWILDICEYVYRKRLGEDDYNRQIKRLKAEFPDGWKTKFRANASLHETLVTLVMEKLIEDGFIVVEEQSDG